MDEARHNSGSAARRITAAAVGVLAFTALVAGGGVFALMQQSLERSVEGMLLTALEVRRQLVQSQVELRETNVRVVARQADLLQALRDGGDSQAVRRSVQESIGGEFTAVTVFSESGDRVASVGPVAHAPTLALGLDSPMRSELLWADGPVLRTRAPVSEGGRVLGSVLVEQRMTVVAELMKAEIGLWRTGEIALCAARGDRVHCYPQRRDARVVEAPLRGEGGAMLPAAHAAAGQTGIVRARDSLGYEVLAAYGPVGNLGLVLAVEVDTEEIAGLLYRQLPAVVFMALAAIGLGVLLLRRRVQPLAAQLSEARAEAGAAHERLQTIADSVPALVGYVDADERYRFANRTYDEWYGIGRHQLLGRRMREVWEPWRYAFTRPHIEKALAGERVDYVQTLATARGSRIVRTSFVPDLGADGKAQGFFLLSSDITESENARKALDRALQKLDLALDASRVAVWETDVSSGETVLSEAWAEILDRQRAETRTTTEELAALVHPDDRARVESEAAAVLKGEKAEYAVEHQVRAESGHWKWILSRGKVVARDPATGRALTLMGTNLDVTERKRGEIRLEKLANYDTLTGCANRNLFSDRLRQAIARCARSKGRAALMYLDIDKFKGINDTLGHDAGDALLKAFAARLKAAVRATDTVGRLGGDEFAILLEEVKEEDAPARVAQKVLEAMRAPVDAVGKPVVVTTSIGIALFGGEAEPEALAKRADVALYEAKAAGRNTYRVGS